MKRQALNKLAHWRSSTGRQPLVLKGARQVGKTWLIKEFGQTSFRQCHYLNFEREPSLAKFFTGDIGASSLVQDLSLHLKTPINVEHDLLVFDEIQACPRAMTSLKYFAEDLPGMALIAAGSLLGLQLGSDSFPVGKVDFLSLHPLSFQEFLEGIEDERGIDCLRRWQKQHFLKEPHHDYLWRLLKHYMICGGLPAVINAYRKHEGGTLRAFTAARHKQRDLIAAYLADIAKHSGKTNAMHIQRVWECAASQISRVMDGSVERFQFKGVIPGKKSYAELAPAIDWLRTAGLVIRAPICEKAQLPLAAFAAENLFKLYLFDVGILGAMLDLSPDVILAQDFGTYKGFFAENLVAQEFIAGGLSQLHAWKENTAEIEFLHHEEGRPLPIEVKSGTRARAKSLSAFQTRYDPPRSIILSAAPSAPDPSDPKTERRPLYTAGLLAASLTSVET